VPDYDPLTISDEELKALPPAERGAVYKARAQARAAGGAPAPPRAPVPSPATTTPPVAATPPAGGESLPVRGISPTPAAGATPPAAATPPAGGESLPVGGTSPSPAAAPAKPAPAAPPAPEKPKEPAFVQRILESIADSSWQWRHGYAEIRVPRETLLDAARALRKEGFDYLSFITEVDWQDRFELIYHVFAYDYLNQPLGVILRTDLPRDALPAVASVTTVWPGAEFMEREAFEMMGIRFLGHPDLRKILLPDDFVGFPMRRDYETNYEYITVKQLVHESD
jgi:NADH-quinone oxidoreductase subunit C